MLSPDTRRQVVRAATIEAMLTAGPDFTSGRRWATLSDADRAIVRDLAKRMAVRSHVVRGIPPWDVGAAVSLFGTVFYVAYDHHLSDLSTGQYRDLDELASQILAAIDQMQRGTGHPSPRR